MLYRKMTKTGDELSILGYGCMRFPRKGVGTDEERTIRQVRYAIDHGVNYLDLSYPYDMTRQELTARIIERALRDGYREKVRVSVTLPLWMNADAGEFDRYLDKQME